MPRRISWLVCTVVVMLATSVASAQVARPFFRLDGDLAGKPADPPTGLKALEGNWKLVRKETKGGLQPSGFRKEGLFFEGGKVLWTQDQQERGGQKGDVTVDASANPKTIDVEITRGSNIGKKLLGIYEFSNGKLTICWGEPGGKRPTKFVTKTAVGAGAELETYQTVDAGPVAGGDKGPANKPAGKADAAAGLKTLEGNWKLTRKEYKGNLQAVGFRKEGLFFEEDKIFWTEDRRERGGQKGDLSIDAAATPKTIDVEITRGSNIGKKLLGIYQVRGDRLTICWGDPGGKRPKLFMTKTAVGAGAELETYQRQKD